MAKEPFQETAAIPQGITHYYKVCGIIYIVPGTIYIIPQSQLNKYILSLGISLTKPP